MLQIDVTRQLDFHFVVLLGSLRRDSYNRAIAATLDELAPDDVAVSMLDQVDGFPHYNEDIKRDTVPSTVWKMANAIVEAGAVIIVTPEYNHSIPGSLKNALDWLSRLAIRPLAHKPIAIQIASTGRFGGISAQKHLREVLISMDAVVLGEPEVVVTHVSTLVDLDKGMLHDFETRQLIGSQLQQLLHLAHETRSSHLHEWW